MVHSLDLSAFHAWHEMPAEGDTTWYFVGGIWFTFRPICCYISAFRIRTTEKLDPTFARTDRIYTEALAGPFSCNLKARGIANWRTLHFRSTSSKSTPCLKHPSYSLQTLSIQRISPHHVWQLYRSSTGIEKHREHATMLAEAGVIRWGLVGAGSVCEVCYWACGLLACSSRPC